MGFAEWDCRPALRRANRWNACTAVLFREARRECCQAGWRRSQVPSGIHLLLRDDFVVETAEEEHAVLPERPANGSAGKLVVKARNLCQSFEGFLRIGQSVRRQRLLSVPYTSTWTLFVPALVLIFTNRAGIASVFGAEVIRNDLVFADKVCVGNKQTGSAN